MKVIMYPAITLDGFIATNEGNSDWVTPADEQIFEDECKKAGCVIVGRTTFEQYKDQIYPIEGTVTYVVTSKAGDFESSDTIKFVRPDAAAICEQIAKDGFSAALLSGGGETNGLFAAAGKIDEAIISIYPQLLGSGVRMLGSAQAGLSLKLLDSQNIGDGVIQNRYKVA